MLITGCNGLLGQKLTALASEDYAVYGLGLRDQSPVRGCIRHYIQLDLTDRKRVLATIHDAQPDWVINTAALTDVDECERAPQRAFEVNVEGVRHLTEGCRRCGARFIQLSTNYIFDGQSSPYAEDDEPHPVNVYGRTKIESERLLHGSGLDYVIIRTVLLYGFLSEARPSFVDWVCSHLMKGDKIKAATDLYCNPTLIDDVSTGIVAAVKRRARGMYHMAGSEGISRYDFALKVARAFGLDSAFIRPVPYSELGRRAPRPLRSELRTNKVRDELGLVFKSVTDGLHEMIRQLREREERRGEGQ